MMKQIKELQFALVVLIVLEIIATFAVAISLSKLCLQMNTVQINLHVGNLI